MNLSTDCHHDRVTILSAVNMAPTTMILARDLDYFWDISEISIAGLAHLGALPSEPGVDVGGRATPCVDLVAALRAYAITNYQLAHYSWGPAIVERIAQVSKDSGRLVDIVGCFAVAASFARHDYRYELCPLPGFVAARHRIFYGTAVHNFKQYCDGNGPE